MHVPRFTLGRHLLIVAAAGVGLASIKGNYLWFSGLSMMTIIALLGTAIGVDPDARRPKPSGPIF